MNKIIKDKLSNSITKEEVYNHIDSTFEILGLTRSDIGFFEGYEYKYQDYSKPLYGVSAAGKHDYFTLYHEIAHGIEIIDESKERVILPRFGMTSNSQLEVNGELYDNPITFQGSERECRVFAIQSHLMAHVFKFNPEEVLEYILEDGVTALRYSSDFLSVPVSRDSNSKESEQSRIEFLQKLTKDYFNKYNIQDLLDKQQKVVEIRNYQSMTNEQLEEIGYHYVHVSQLLEYTNPLNAWIELEGDPITEEEVYNCLSENNDELTNTPLWSDKKLNKDKARENHIKKIAYFLKNKYTDPIDIEVNVEGNGSDVLWINDGNHRLAAEYLREKNSQLIHNHIIKTKISGDLNRAKNLYLWGPNPFLRELNDRFEKEFEISMQENIDKFYKNVKKNNFILKSELTELDSITQYLSNKKEDVFTKKEKFISQINVDWSKVDFKSNEYPFVLEKDKVKLKKKI